MRSLKRTIQVFIAFGATPLLIQNHVWGADIKLTPISTPFPSPIGIDYHEPTDSVVMSVNYSSGVPHNFERVQADGTHVPFSTISGFTEEVKIATARSGSVFPAGTLFTGNGVDGQVARISPDGLTVLNPWVDLPGAGNGLMRGSLYVDRTGVWGGDLLVATTAGELWRINSAGVPTFVNDVDVHLEGMITVPADAAKYGPLAGKAIVGAEEQTLLYAFDTTGGFSTFSVGVSIEDIDLIPANENFFGVNYGSSLLLGAPASDFDGIEGDILLTQEFDSDSGLHRLYWNGSSLVAEPLGLKSGSATPAQWEHVTFAPAGIVEIPPINSVPEQSSTLALLGFGLATLACCRKAFCK
jgi:hypothetical protein